MEELFVGDLAIFRNAFLGAVNRGDQKFPKRNESIIINVYSFKNLLAFLNCDTCLVLLENLNESILNFSCLEISITWIIHYVKDVDQSVVLVVILEFHADKVEQREGLIVEIFIFSKSSQPLKTLFGNLFHGLFFLCLSFGDSLDALLRWLFHPLGRKSSNSWPSLILILAKKVFDKLLLNFITILLEGPFENSIIFTWEIFDLFHEVMSSFLFILVYISDSERKFSCQKSIGDNANWPAITLCAIRSFFDDFGSHVQDCTNLFFQIVVIHRLL